MTLATSEQAMIALKGSVPHPSGHQRLIFERL